MYSGAMLLLAAFDALLCAWMAREFLRTRQGVLGLILFLAAALPYDTALVGLGRFIGIGPTLELLSAPRFMLFNLSLPLILIVAVGLVRLAGLGWAQPRWVIGGTCLIATALIILDWRHIALVDPLYPACWRDTVRYVPSVLAEQACAVGQPGVGVAAHFPQAGMAALPALLVAGALVWWQARWPWMLLGTVAAFALLGLPPRIVGPLPGFVGDALNLLALAATAVHFAGPGVPRHST